MSIPSPPPPLSFPLAHLSLQLRGVASSQVCPPFPLCEHELQQRAVQGDDVEGRGHAVLVDLCDKGEKPKGEEVGSCKQGLWEIGE